MLTHSIEIVLLAATFLVSVPVVVIFVQAVLAATYRPRAAVSDGARPRIAVLVPAHNESAIIAATLRAIGLQLKDGDRLIVVADNCTDATAHISANLGAEVLVRNNSALRGKGYALDYGIRHLEADPPAVVIVIDADCRVAPETIDRLAKLCAAKVRPIQSLNLMHAAKDASPSMQIAEFAFRVKNQVRPTAMHRLGLPCQLMGTGMAFPWEIIKAAPLATGEIAEDLQLGIDLARSGSPPVFCPTALVSSDFPISADGIDGQRTRWEHGYLGVLVREAPRLFIGSILKFDFKMLAFSLDLVVPPLSLLTLQVLTVWLAAAAFFALSIISLPFNAMTVVAALLVLSILICWIGFGRDIISIGGLSYALVYPLKKISLYARFFVARQMDWVRSKREGD